MKLLAIALLALALAGCGSAAGAAHPTRTSASHTALSTTSAAPASAYPDQAADSALCNTYNSDIQTADTYDIGQALQQAEGSVSPKLARDIQTLVVNSSSANLQTDLKTR